MVLGSDLHQRAGRGGRSREEGEVEVKGRGGEENLKSRRSS